MASDLSRERFREALILKRFCANPIGPAEGFLRTLRSAAQLMPHSAILKWLGEACQLRPFTSEPRLSIVADRRLDAITVIAQSHCGIRLVITLDPAPEEAIKG